MPFKGVDFGRAPPGVESATVQPLATETPRGNALLEVKFDDRDKRIGTAVPIFPHGERVLLVDDGTNGDAKAGDGVFSATVRFDFRELQGQADAVARAADRVRPQPVFIGRELVGVDDPAVLKARLGRFTELRNLDRFIAGRLRFDLLDLIPSVDPSSIDPARSLVITAPSVVADPARTIDPCTGVGNPDGVWTFKHLVTEMVAGTGVDPADFVEAWLRLWDSNQTVSSGFIAAPRSAILPRVLDPWPRTPGGKLDLDQSPFRLSAIVNRIDLGSNSIYGGGSAGEGRFVFGVRDRTAPGCVILPFAVIFEYGVPKSGCHAIRDWAKQWVDLSTIPIGTAAYNAALEVITETFAAAGAAPAKPNGSALNQLRTNENALDPLWELREFRIDAASHLLFEDTTKQTLDESLNNSATLADYINANAPAIVADAHVVPDHFPSATDPFMAATSRASAAQLSTHFGAPGVLDNNARFHFSFNTCSACHIRETGTILAPPGNNGFLHIDPRPMPAALSRFMTGNTASISDTAPADPGFSVIDPADPTTVHVFNDLDNRRVRLAAIAGSSCFRLLLVPPFRLIEKLPRVRPGDPPPLIRDPRLIGVNIPNRMVH